ncbi:hypothetical protein [Bacillus sp. SJS]|uniref:hypothetical protein n=1 Tax=Bacillus sp. SJS TaxID=1423321 RepID=UPI0004DD4EB9|nr:hypothetical protein [Bacillus sp. SJS]KZZ83921.1 hypothetical protein AS29_014335 [Bacillus sp. SJS]
MTDIQIKPEELLELAQKIGQSIQIAQEGQSIITEASSYATTDAIENAKMKLLKQLELYLETLDHGHQKVFIAREVMIATDENYAATYNVDLWGMPKSIEQNPIAVTEWKRKNIYMENGVLVNPMGHKVVDSQTRPITDEELRSAHNFGVYQVFENGQIYFVQGKRFVDKIPELEPEGNARPTDLLEGTGYEWVEYMGGPLFFGKKLAKNAIKKLEDEIGDIGKSLSKGTSKAVSDLDQMKSLIKNGKVKGNNIISKIDDNTQVIFRKDTGKNSHPIRPKYPNAVEHYNVEIQTKTSAGKWKSRESYHIIVDNNGKVIDRF